MAFRGRGSNNGKDWNPMESAYNDGSFNSYKEGPGVGHQPNSNRNYSDKSQGVKLFVGNIDRNTTREGLENIFSACGVKPSNVYKKDTDQATTYGFVEYVNHSDAENAIRSINRQPPHNLMVRYKQTEEERKRKVEESARQAIAPATYQNNRGKPPMPNFPDQSGGMDMVNGARQAGFGTRTSRNFSPNDPNDVACEPGREGFYDPNSAGEFEDVDRAVMGVVEADTVNNFSIRAGVAGRRVSYGRGYYAPSTSNGQPTRMSNSSPRANNFAPSDREPEPEATSRSVSTSSPVLPAGLPVPVCQKCMMPAASVCNLCKLARYCSDGCAVEHWPAHMFHCIATIPPPGTCVLDDSPARMALPSQPRANVSQPLMTNGSAGHLNNSSQNRNTFTSSAARNSVELPVTPNASANLNQRFAPPRTGNNNSNTTTNSTTDASFGLPLTASTPHPEPAAAASSSGGEWEKTEELPADVYSQVMVTTALPNCLWVQQAVHGVKVVDLVKELTKAGPALPPAEPRLGHVYAGKFMGEWHRVKVLAVQPRLRVLYIDYGNEEEKPAGELRALPEAYTKIRALAARVTLVDGTSDKYRGYTYDSKLHVKPVAKNADGSVSVEVRGPPRPAEPTVQRQVGAKLTQELPTGKYTEVIALSSLEPGQKAKEFLVSVKSVSGELEKQVNHLSGVSPSLPTCSDVNVGDIVAAEYLEGGWYRAKVLSMSPIKVLYIDFGNDETISLKQMRVLPEEHLSLPGQAIRVKLAENSSRTVVTEDDILMVKPMSMTADGCVVIEVSGAAAEAAAPAVASPSVAPPPLLASPLVARPPLLSTPPSTAATAVLLTTKDDLPCNRSATLPSHTFTEVAVRVTGNTEYFVNIFANGRQIDEQMSKMMADKRSFVACQPMLNSLVALSIDGKLYRGKVVSLVPLKVLCIDFGMVEVVTPTKMRALPREFTILPAQAIKISLCNETSSQYRNLPLDARVHVKPVDKLPDATVVVQIQGDEQKQKPSPASPASPATAAPTAPTFKTAAIPSNVASSVTITVPGETEYWVQLSSNIDTVTDMIGAMFRDCPTCPTISDPRKGQLVAAKFEEIWYRMRVDEVKGSTVLGRSADYGFEYGAAMEEIRALQPQFTDLPLQGIQIKLQAGTPRKYYNLAEDSVILVKQVEMTPSGIVIVSVEDPPTHEEANNAQSYACDKSIVLPTDDFTEVMFVVKENDELWVQENPPLALVTLMKNFNSNKQNLVRCEARVGAMVALMFDGEWSRAKVVAVEPKIMVHFIDYGNKAFVTADELRTLPEDMLSIPAQAVRITLDAKTPESIALLPTDETPFYVKPISVAADGSVLVLGRQ